MSSEEQKTPQDEQYHFFKVPTSEKSLSAKNHIVCLIDASDSMTPAWGFLANDFNKVIACAESHKKHIITFDDLTHICERPELSTNIDDHGGYTTNIVAAFQKFEEYLVKVPKEDTVSAIFISDGYDDEQDTVEERCREHLTGNTKPWALNFLCMGVGSNFPTKLALALKEKYHRGNPNIPPVYLIDNDEINQEAIFETKFLQMKTGFDASNEIQFEQNVFKKPWEQPSHGAFEGEWIYTTFKKLDILGDRSYKLGADYGKLSTEDVIDINKSMMVYLATECKDISEEKTQEHAINAQELLKKLNAEYSDLLNKNPQNIKVINMFGDEIQKFANKVIPKTDYELAKILEIANKGGGSGEDALKALKEKEARKKAEKERAQREAAEKIRLKKEEEDRKRREAEEDERRERERIAAQQAKLKKKFGGIYGLSDAPPPDVDLNKTRKKIGPPKKILPSDKELTKPQSPKSASEVRKQLKQQQMMELLKKQGKWDKK